MTRAFAGIAIGLAATWSFARLLDSFLFGVTVHDALVFISVPAVLSLIALGATWVPARRASNADPMIALRSE